MSNSVIGTSRRSSLSGAFLSLRDSVYSSFRRAALPLCFASGIASWVASLAGQDLLTGLSAIVMTVCIPLIPSEK